MFDSVRVELECHYPRQLCERRRREVRRDIREMRNTESKENTTSTCRRRRRRIRRR